MKLKEFIENLSKLDQDIDVCVYARSAYDGSMRGEYPHFAENGDDCSSNIEVKTDTVYLGG